MKKFLCIFLSAVLLLGLCACGSSGAETPTGDSNGAANDSGLAEGQLLVGYGKTNITPEDSVPLAGYGNTSMRMSTGFLDYLYATCIAITDSEGNTAIVYGVDLTSSSSGAVDAVRDSLSQKYNIPTSAIAISASHNHSAPDTGSSLDVIQTYNTFLGEQLLKAAEKAMEDRAPADLYSTTVMTEGLNFVRRYKLEGEIYIGYQSDVADYGLPIVGYETEADHSLQLIKFDRAGDKKDILLSNFQTHPHREGSATNTLATADLVGVYRETVEKELDCLAIYFTGASGNINPSSPIKDHNITKNYKEQGQALAKYAINAEGTYTKLSGGKVQSKTVEFVGDINHSQDNMVAIAREAQVLWAETNSIPKVREFGKPYGINSPYHAGAIISKASLPATKSFKISAISIGDVGFAIAPYEMFDTQGSFIKENSPFKNTIIATCANGSNGYFPSLFACEHGGYEPDTTRFVPGTAEKLADQYVAMLTELHGAA